MKQMISSAQKRAAGQADAQMLPLIRLRVDYTGFSTINAQRFGQQFVGKVANPHDLLLFQKTPARKPKVHHPSTGRSTAPVVTSVLAFSTLGHHLLLPSATFG